VITADARIDNREALIQDLHLPKEPGQVISDTALILRAYEKWGRDCTDHLLGAFVFTIWDPREHHLFCVQDHFGLRPFYYYHDQGEFFAFASEIKALLELESVPREFNQVRIAEHLMAPVEEDVTRTYFRHIHRTAPAHALIVRQDTLRKIQYWSLDPNQEVHLSSDEEYAERFRGLFEEAVQSRLRSVGPVGSELSGGLDSSSVTCQAAQILRDTGDDTSIHTFSVVFDEALGKDEHPYIDAVLEKYSELKSHLIWGDKKSPIDEWGKLYRYLDEACEAPNVYIPLRANQLAQEKGMRVVLSGFDGDTTISHGRGYFYQLRNEKKWMRLAREVGAYAKRIGDSPRGAIWSWIKGPLFSLPGMSQFLDARRLARSFFRKDEPQNETTEDDVQAWQRALRSELRKEVEPYLRRAGDTVPDTEREHHHRLLTQPAMQRTPYLESHLGSMSSVVNRYPFFDKNLIEFCLALPPQQKIRNGWSRLILRHGMDGVLPSPIQWREDKTNYGPQQEHLLRKYEKGLLESLKEGELEEIYRFVEPEFIQESVPNFLESRSRGMEKHVLWRTLALALWLS
jgi:asparagine synthase (glutamine-hydrolysing)